LYAVSPRLSITPMAPTLARHLAHLRDGLFFNQDQFRDNRTSVRRS
jgi:hypothetical protein